MDKRDARREVLTQDPKVTEVVRQTQQFVGEIQSAKLARAVNSERQLNEVMVDFWENHFSVFAGKGQTRLFLSSYDRDVIRPRALGKFRDLLGAVAKSPAMLFFLDNAQSAADSTQPTLVARNGGRGGRGGLIARRPGLGGVGRGQQLPPAARQRLENATPAEREQLMQRLQQQAKRGLNENYARELMELHTLGVDGGYTQKDVQEVARALTGWTFNRQSGEFLFNPAIHDAGEKTILGKKFAAGRGVQEGEEVLDMVARAPATARFITTKLARHFVSDDPPKALVDRCANTFSNSDGDIRETLRCVITSPEFFSRQAYRAKVKTPFEVVASRVAGRERAARFHAADGAGRRAAGTTDLRPADAGRLARPRRRVDEHRRDPESNQLWIEPGSRTASDGKLNNWTLYDSLRTLSRSQQVDGVVKSMLGGQVSVETREVLMSGENPMLARAGAASDINGMAVIDSGTMMGGGRAGAGRPVKNQGVKGFPRVSDPGLWPSGGPEGIAAGRGPRARRSRVSTTIVGKRILI